MAAPRTPLRTYLPPQPGDLTFRLSASDAPPCDPELPVRALRHRAESGLMKVADFSSHNITVWKLVSKSGKVEYIARQNTTIGELAKEFGPAADRSSEVGLHSEMLVAQEIYLRSDVRKQETVVAQVFTERFPCRECQSLLTHYKQFKHAPFYYYLSYSDKAWQKTQVGGTWGQFLMQCYGV